MNIFKWVCPLQILSYFKNRLSHIIISLKTTPKFFNILFIENINFQYTVVEEIIKFLRCWQFLSIQCEI